MQLSATIFFLPFYGVLQPADFSGKYLCTELRFPLISLKFIALSFTQPNTIHSISIENAFNRYCFDDWYQGSIFIIDISRSMQLQIFFFFITG